MGTSFGAKRRLTRAWTPAKIRTYLSQLLARRAWSRQALLNRLEERGIPGQQAQAALAELEMLGYLDDERYAAAWAQARAQRGLGARRIAEELRERGVPRELAEHAARESFQEVSEAARASEVATRRLPALLVRGGPQAESRLRQFLFRRGFSSDVVSSVIRSLLGTRPQAPPD